MITVHDGDDDVDDEVVTVSPRPPTTHTVSKDRLCCKQVLWGSPRHWAKTFRHNNIMILGTIVDI